MTFAFKQLTYKHLRYQLIIKLGLARLIWRSISTKLRFFLCLSIEIRNRRYGQEACRFPVKSSKLRGITRNVFINLLRSKVTKKKKK